MEPITRAFSLLLGSWLALCWPIDRLNASLTAHAARILNGVGIGALLITLLGFFYAARPKAAGPIAAACFFTA